MRKIGFLAIAGPLVVGVVALAYAGFKVERRKHLSQASYLAEHEALVSDPEVVSFLDKGNAICPKQTASYIWACGVLLEMQGLDRSKSCSTRQEPRFAGNLDDHPMGLQWLWDTEYAVPAFPLESYVVSIQGTRKRVWSYPVNEIPDDIPEEPIFPAYKWNTFFSHGPEAWAKHDNMPVAFDFNNFLSKMPSEILPSECFLKTMHPKLPISIGIKLPCKHLPNWREILADVNSRISDAVLDFDQGAQCDMPPKSARFSVNAFNDDKIRAMRNWILARSKLEP